MFNKFLDKQTSLLMFQIILNYIFLKTIAPNHIFAWIHYDMDPYKKKADLSALEIRNI